MGKLYCSIEDVYRVGVPRGALISPSRVVASADATLDRLALEGHGFADGTAIQFQIELGGVLPAPLSLLTTYYAKLVPLAVAGFSDSLFQVAATPGGAAIDLTTVGTPVFNVFAPLGPAMLDEIETMSRWMDNVFVAHGAPFDPLVPVMVKNYTAKRVAASMVRVLGLGDQLSGILDQEDVVIKDALRMSKSGAPFRDTDAGAETYTSVHRSASDTVEATRGTIP